GKQVRWQGLLKQKEKTWVLEDFRPAALEHSGHPELLATQEGVILYIATEGIHWTDDVGKTWTPVIFPGLAKSFRPSTANLRSRLASETHRQHREWNQECEIVTKGFSSSNFHSTATRLLSLERVRLRIVAM
ncbi:MAG TPA: hypothetical protein VM260_13885, partial [Pirellula sp.]|nr:hypothetical protein [Pirellula sp.]